MLFNCVSKRGASFSITGIHSVVGRAITPDVNTRTFASVSGAVYESESSSPVVKLFTKEGCTLCDEVKDVLSEVREEYPHTLLQVDITDEEHQAWFGKYKYDIPILHLEDKFWIKHRTTLEEVKEGFLQAQKGTFKERLGEPDAEALERRQAERRIE